VVDANSQPGAVRMEFRHIEAFIVVAEELNFRRAAVRLHMAQPSLSQNIKRLEHDVGVRLLQRTTRHVTLTPAGEAFLPEAQRIVQAARAAPETARRAAAGRVGVVRLGFSGPTSYEVLIRLTTKFRKHRPRVRLEIVGPVYDGGEFIERLDRREIDAGLIRPQASGSERIEIREITRHEMAVALPSDHPLATKQEVHLLDLRDELVISYAANRGPGMVSLIHSTFLKHGFSPNIAQEAPDTHTIMSLVGAGAGIGFVPVAAGHIKLPGVVLVPVPDIPAIPLVLGWRKNDPNPALHALIDLADEVSAECESPATAEGSSMRPSPPAGDELALP
jgi:DNA-binding transcriptional LysR family regulator